MPGISRVGVDSAGGLIIGVKAPSVYVNGSNVVCIGAAIAGHGIGTHSGPVMATGSSKVFANKIGICRQGDLASCGDVASGSVNAFAG